MLDRTIYQLSTVVSSNGKNKDRKYEIFIDFI